MSFVDNLKNGINDFLGNRSETVSLVKKAPQMSGRMDVLGLPVPPDKKDSDYIGAMRGWVYRAVDAIAQEVAKMELVLYQKKGSKINEIESHPAIDVLNRVNGFQTKYDFLYGISAYQELVGEAFAYKDQVGGKTRELWLLRPDYIKILPPENKGDYIGGYNYKVPSSQSSVDYKVEQIIQFKFFDPTNPYRGLGPLQACAYAYDTDLFASKWNRNFFYNNAIPNTVLTTDQNLKEKDIDRIKSEFRSKFGGTRNAHKFAILTGGLKVDMGMKQTIKDMDFLKSRTFSRDEIFTIFQVPKTVIGITDDVNRANAKESKAVWLENVIIPKMNKLVAFLNEFYITDWGDDLYFGFKDPVPESTEFNLKIQAEAKDILSINERRELVGYDMIEGGDVISIPSDNPQEPAKSIKVGGIKKKPDRIFVKHKTTPYKMIANRIREEMETNGTNEALKKFVYLMMSKKAHKKIKKKKDLIHLPRESAEVFWQKMVDRSEAQEITFNKLIKKYWKRQSGVVKDHIVKIKSIKRVKKIENYLFNNDIENDLLMSLVTPLINKIVAQAGVEALDLLGLDGFKFTDETIRVISKFGLLMSDSINTTTMELLKVAIQAGLSEGDTINQIASRIDTIFSDKARSQMIARSEVMRANNLGHLEGYKQSGVVDFKEWVTAMDERTCEFCLRMEKEYAVKTLDQNYLNKYDELLGLEGGVLKMDYASLSAPPLHPNCRCVIVPVVKLGKSYNKDYVWKHNSSKRVDDLKAKIAKKKAEMRKVKKGITEVKQEIANYRESKTKEVDKLAKKELERRLKIAKQKEANIIKEAEAIRDEQRTLED